MVRVIAMVSFVVAASACGGGSSCPSPQIGCNGVCVDPTTDRNHCGACNQVCPGDSICDQSECTCPDVLTFCTASCVDTASDDANCGACGQACAPGAHCENATCVAPATMTGCNGYEACLSGCMDSSCQDACFASTTTQGQTLADTLNACLGGACPSTAGAVCDPNAASPDPCANCVTAAQGGACANEYTACLMDTP